MLIEWRTILNELPSNDKSVVHKQNNESLRNDLWSTPDGFSAPTVSQTTIVNV